MPSTHSVTLRFPLPSYLSPEVVIDHIQSYTPFYEAQPYVQSYDRRQISVKDVDSDPFFTAKGHKLEGWTFTERIPIIPIKGLKNALSKDITVPSIWQSFENGARCRADAQAGVKVYAQYEVRRRRSEESEVVSPGAGEHELVEHAWVTCSPILMPFVSKSFETAHKEICQKIIDGLIKLGGQTAHFGRHSYHAGGQVAQSDGQGYETRRQTYQGSGLEYQNLAPPHQNSFHATQYSNQGYEESGPGTQYDTSAPNHVDFTHQHTSDPAQAQQWR